MTFKIGNIEIKNQVVVAPMSGVTNSAYRIILKNMGAGLIYAEMVSDKAVCYDSKKTLDLLKMSDYERPIAQQIFGSDVTSFVEAAKKVYEIQKPDIIDINMGCPVPKVAIKNQAGSALLKNPKLIGEIISAVVKAVPVPVTVKIRSGWDSNSINAVEVAKVAEKAGASAIAIHTRTRSQGYSGKADWSIIKKVKEAVSIPVIGNGDITSPMDAKKMLEETNCDAIMIGRGLLGNPWLIRDTIDYLDKGIINDVPTYQEKIFMMKKHFNLLCSTIGEVPATLEIRQFILYYLKGMPKNKEIKVSICKCKTKEEILNILDNYSKELESIL